MTEPLYIKELSEIENDLLLGLAKELYNTYKTTMLTSTLKNKIEPYLSMLKAFYVDKDINPHIFCNNIVNAFYPNETIIKAQFINKVISRTNKHVTIFELAAGQSRIDICKINGESIAYEVKTEFDNLRRLDKQMSDYNQIFDKTYVITTEKHYNQIISKIPLNCGIYLYRKTKSHEYVFHVVRKATKSGNISPHKQLGTLTLGDLSSNFDVKGANTRSEIIEAITKDNSVARINQQFKNILIGKYNQNWQFLASNLNMINEIDYQWFFQNNIIPAVIYNN